MATSTFSRVIPPISRKRERSTYGTLDDLLAGAELERRAGRPANAWCLNQEVLGQSLRRHWLHVCKRDSPITDPLSLLVKLRSCGSIDRWSYDLFRLALTRPSTMSDLQVRLLNAVVQACSDSLSE